jgi:two-component system, OmpR family, phosphate regulon sensor histidine kinase PhoR
MLWNVAFGLTVAVLLWMVYELSIALRMLVLLKRGVHTLATPPGLMGALTRQGLLRRGKATRRHRRLSALLGAMRALGRALPDGLAVIDENARLVWRNSQANVLLGGELNNVSPLRLGLIFSDARAQAWFESNSTEPLLDVPSPGNPSLRLSLKLLPFIDQHRLLIARDVSAAMRQAQVRRDFVANVSHELRTPLTVINGYLDTFEPEELPEYADVLAQMRHQSQRMVQIVEDLLTLARLDHATENPEDYVATGPLLGYLLSDANGLSRGQHEVSLYDSLPMDLIGNEKDLRSAFSNLVSNAVRYTPSGGKIVLSWAWHSEGAVFSVQDSGVGIPEHHLPRLTERFYRVSASRSRESGGTGLGLAIVNHVLEVHDGRLQIESVIGQGSCFKCILPRERLRYRETV